MRLFAAVQHQLLDWTTMNTKYPGERLSEISSIVNVALMSNWYSNTQELNRLAGVSGTCDFVKV
jgi:hypothetical protein